jgi:orotate phosphoribosyltransferase
MQNDGSNAAGVLLGEDVERALIESGALMEGHFLLASGRHSHRYIEKFRLLEQPRLTSRLCAEIARRFQEDNIHCVVGPVTGGIILAFETARHLGTRAVYAERGEGGAGFVFRRGFTLAPGERVLVVEDIVTTGGSVFQVLDAVRAAGGEPVGVALLVDRSNGSVQFPVARTEALLRLSVESYEPGNVPPWIEEKYGPALKPGSSPQ